MNAVLATGLLYAFGQSDLQGKVIVVILCLGSALTWTVMLTKWQQLLRTRATALDFLKQFRRDHDPLHLFINNFEFPEVPLYRIYRMGAEEVSSQLGGKRPRPVVAPGSLPFAESDPAPDQSVKLDSLRNALGRAIDIEVIRLESHLPVLSTAVQGGPFLGLLGSAWGVMSVFASMGIEGSVQLTKVAPGISAALLATVVGLLVAVPSLFAYNWLAARVRHQTMELENFADEFIAAVEHRYPTR